MNEIDALVIFFCGLALGFLMGRNLPPMNSSRTEE